MQQRSSNAGDLQDTPRSVFNRSRTSVLQVSERPSKANVSQESRPSLVSRARTTLQDTGSARLSLSQHAACAGKRGTILSPMPNDNASEKSKRKRKQSVKLVAAVEIKSSEERRTDASKLRAAFSQTRSVLADIREQGGKATFAGVAGALKSSLQKLNLGLRFCGAIKEAAMEGQDGSSSSAAEDNELQEPLEKTTEKQVFLKQVQELLLKEEEPIDWLEHLASIVKPLHEAMQTEQRTARKESVWHANFLADLGNIAGTDSKKTDGNFQGLISDLNETLSKIERFKKRLEGQLEELECLQMDSLDESTSKLRSAMQGDTLEESSSSDSSSTSDEARKHDSQRTHECVAAPATSRPHSPMALATGSRSSSRAKSNFQSNESEVWDDVGKKRPSRETSQCASRSASRCGSPGPPSVLPTPTTNLLVTKSMPPQESFQDSIMSSLVAQTGEDAMVASSSKLEGLSSSIAESHRASNCLANESESGNELTISALVGSSSSNNMQTATRNSSIHVIPTPMQLGVAQLGFGMSVPSSRRTSAAEEMSRRASLRGGGYRLNPMIRKISTGSTTGFVRSVTTEASQAPVEDLRSTCRVTDHVFKMRRVVKRLKEAQHDLAAIIVKAAEGDMGRISKDTDGQGPPPLQSELREKLAQLTTGDELDKMIVHALGKLPNELWAAAEEANKDVSQPASGSRQPSQNADQRPSVVRSSFTSLQGDRRASGVVPSLPSKRNSLAVAARLDLVAKPSPSQQPQHLGDLLGVTVGKPTKDGTARRRRCSTLNTLSEASDGKDNQQSPRQTADSEEASCDSKPSSPRARTSTLSYAGDMSVCLQGSGNAIPKVPQESLAGMDENSLGTLTTNFTPASEDDQSSPADLKVAQPGKLGAGAGLDLLEKQLTRNRKNSNAAALMGRRSFIKSVNRTPLHGKVDHSLHCLAIQQNVTPTVTRATDIHTASPSIAVNQDERRQSSEEQNPKCTDVNEARKTTVTWRKTIAFSQLRGWSKTLDESDPDQKEIPEANLAAEKTCDESQAVVGSEVEEAPDLDRHLAEDDKQSTYSRPASARSGIPLLQTGPKQLQPPILSSSAAKERARLAGRQIVEENKMQCLLLQEVQSQWRPRLTTTKPAHLFEVPLHPLAHGDMPRLQTPRRAKDRNTFKENAARSAIMKLHLRPAKHMRVNIIAEDTSLVEQLYRIPGTCQRSAAGGVHTAHTLRTACIQPGRSSLQHRAQQPPPFRGSMDVHLWGWELEDLCGETSCIVPEVPEVGKNADLMEAEFQSIDGLDVDLSAMDFCRD